MIKLLGLQHSKPQIFLDDILIFDMDSITAQDHATTNIIHMRDTPIIQEIVSGEKTTIELVDDIISKILKAATPPDLHGTNSKFNYTLVNDREMRYEPYAKFDSRTHTQLTFDFEVRLKKKSCTSFFTVSFVSAYFITAVMMSMFYALGVAESSPKGTQKFTAAMSGLSSLVLTMLTFTYSGALGYIHDVSLLLNRTLCDRGNQFEYLKSELHSLCQLNHSSSPNHTSRMKENLIFLGFSIIVLIGVTSGSLTMYQSIKSLGDKPDSVLSKKFIPFLAYGLAAFNFMDGLIVYESFAWQASRELSKNSLFKCVNKRLKIVDDEEKRVEMSCAV